MVAMLIGKDLLSGPVVIAMSMVDQPLAFVVVVNLIAEDLLR